VIAQKMRCFKSTCGRLAPSLFLEFTMAQMSQAEGPKKWPHKAGQIDAQIDALEKLQIQLGS